MPSRPTSFTPWAPLLKAGLFFMAAGVAIAGYGFNAGNLVLTGLGVISFFLGKKIFSRGWIRRRGKKVEVRAVRAVSLPSGWRSQHSKMLSTGGDIDLFITDPGQKAFAVEIKSINGLKIKRSFFGLGATRFELLNGQPVRFDPMQIVETARRINAVPVLWIPLGDAKTQTLSCGLVIVQGGERRLRRAIGASPWYFPF